jgi:hypothetical protein
MTEQAKKARNAYQRKWRKENPEKFQAQRERYWERKAARMQAEAEQQTKTTGTADQDHRNSSGEKIFDTPKTFVLCVSFF